jgi:hypothetical protein
VAVGEGALDALWTLPALITVHLVQLFLSGSAWRSLFAGPTPEGGSLFPPETDP